MTNKPSYKRGPYKPRTKDARTGTFREGSERWFMQKFNISRHQARKIKKSLEK